MLLQNLSDCSVNISNSVTLQCNASGVPRPLITWYKDRRKLKQVSGEQEIQEVVSKKQTNVAVDTNLLLLASALDHLLRCRMFMSNKMLS